MTLKTKGTITIACALLVFLIDWGVLGIKLYQGEYEIMAEAAVGLVCFAALIVGIILRAIGDRCPYCGKIRRVGGKVCLYCGKIAE
ncbi:MAG: hypothetical protein Q4A66_01435 [Eubacteriales bacterium]|nr:hypothetical protein [Eubacteriales bacterium]